MTGVSPDPFQRIRGELVKAAARQRRRRLLRMRLLFAAALPTLLVVASAGAAGAGHFSTGIAVIDELLATGQPEEGSTDLRPGQRGASAPLRLPDAPDGKGATALAYVSRDGRICTVQGDFRRSDDAPRGSSGGPCYAPRDLSKTLSVSKAICCGSVSSPDRRIYDGLAADEVVALRFHVEGGPTVQARLTPTWAPTVSGAPPLRVFAAVDERDIDVGGDGVQLAESHLLSPRYRVAAELRNGSTVPVGTPRP